MSLWQRDADLELLTLVLVDVASLSAADARALAAALFPLDGQSHVAIVESPDDIVSRADLRRLADRSQYSGPEMAYAWAAYKAAGFESLTPWQAFVAGIRAAAEWRRG